MEQEETKETEGERFLLLGFLGSDRRWHAKAATALRCVAAVQNLAEILKAQEQRASVVECGDEADAAERSLCSHRFGGAGASKHLESPANHSGVDASDLRHWPLRPKILFV